MAREAANEARQKSEKSDNYSSAKDDSSSENDGMKFLDINDLKKRNRDDDSDS